MITHEDHQHEHDTLKKRYFLPNQAIIHLEHPRNRRPNQLKDDVDGFLNTDYGYGYWKDQLSSPTAESILTFSGGETDFSIVPTSFVAPVAATEEEDEYHKTAAAIGNLNMLFVDNSGGVKNDANVYLKSAAPNWLIGAGSHQIGIGGPGNWPEGVPVANGRWPMFNFADASLLVPQKDDLGKGVHVAILDSAPCLHELAEAYEYWHEHHGGDHLLLEKLLEPGGPLHVYPATFDDLRSIADYSAAGHRYPMTDHGLFIAGIIHTIAPAATLHLYEVLNPYGMGSIESIARGIFNAQSNPKIDGPLVFNFSFMLGGSLGEGFEPDVPVFGSAPGSVVENLTLTAKMLFEGIEKEIVDERENKSVMVVAAAGNDAVSGAARPPARYPAAYDNVIGVGALTKTAGAPGIKEFASYSNLADKSPERGYLTLGGEKGDGIEGIYIGKLPVNLSGLPDGDPGIQPEDVGYVPNFERGWARWSGTSFATPIISGLLAAWWGEHPSQGTTDARSFLDGTATAPSPGATSFAGTEKIITTDRV